MKIIIDGHPNPEERHNNKTVRFHCYKCGCIFDAGKDEYEAKEYGYYLRAHCPACSCVVVVSKGGSPYVYKP